MSTFDRLKKKFSVRGTLIYCKTPLLLFYTITRHRGPLRHRGPFTMLEARERFAPHRTQPLMNHNETRLTLESLQTFSNSSFIVSI
jgi:hypothetical protein